MRTRDGGEGRGSYEEIMAKFPNLMKTMTYSPSSVSNSSINTKGRSTLDLPYSYCEKSENLEGSKREMTFSGAAFLSEAVGAQAQSRGVVKPGASGSHLQSQLLGGLRSGGSPFKASSGKQFLKPLISKTRRR
jgi:hypothetical protein